MFKLPESERNAIVDEFDPELNSSSEKPLDKRMWLFASVCGNSDGDFVSEYSENQSTRLRFCYRLVFAMNHK